MKRATTNRGLSPSSGFEKRWKKRLLVPLAVLSTLVAVGLAMAADIPHSFGTGGVISATKFNENFTYIIDRLWDKSGSNFYYNGGNVGIGTTEPNAKFAVQQTGGEDAIIVQDSAQPTTTQLQLATDSIDM
ncbi:MAG: hypothetical protein GY866_15500, partial [Proteobacteria bacterium]|nr:hypothetical protein [Pseudomonadota bacterium]